MLDVGKNFNERGEKEMASINKVIIVGNLGRDPETRVVPSNNQQFTTISVATTEAWNDRNTNERREITEWHRVVFWGKQAETAARYLKKGSQVYIEGKLKTRKYTDKAGIERFTTEIVCDVMQMLGSRPASAEGEDYSRPAAQNAPRPTSAPPPSLSEMSDDIPF